MARRNFAVRLVSFAISFPITVIVILFAISNRGLVPMRLWPLPAEIEAPLYILVLVCVGLGFLLGGGIAWAGELGHKTRAARAERRAEDLERELSVMRIREEELRARANLKGESAVPLLEAGRS
jgi:uncharacterized integral membrane protein